jgi:hypothetical protein
MRDRRADRPKGFDDTQSDAEKIMLEEIAKGATGIDYRIAR